MPLAGGHSNEKPIDDEHRAKFMDMKSTVEAKAGKTFGEFEPISYTQQVVAGTVYHIKFKVGDAKYMVARVFVPLPCNGGLAECQAVAEGKSEGDPIEFLASS